MVLPAVAPPVSRNGKGKAGGKRGEGGQSGARFTARNLADDYLRLCHAPLKDLKRWLAEDKKHKGHAGGQARRDAGLLRTGGMNDADTQRAAIGMGHGERLRAVALHELRGGLDAYRGGRRHADGLLAGSRARLGRYDGLLTLRSAETGRVAGGAASGGGIDAGWPDAMKRELAAAKTPAERLAWASRWGAVLSGQVADVQRVYRPQHRAPVRPDFRRSAATLSRPAPPV
jgi:hypothetical protein